MKDLNESFKFFDKNGWRLPKGIYETFSSQPKWFFKLGENLFDDETAIDRIDEYQEIGLKKNSIEALSELNNKINSNLLIKNLNKGPKVPFVIKKVKIDDIGNFLEKVLLEKVSKSFTDFYPDSHFIKFTFH